ncbi:SDR family NAD(P)-dependent oxidoreductase [Pseudomonas sp. NPDC089996]|uniref:SDR family NAD(P)-dependent oxidoreductase n=1 Tax=Pseudomonas sp. NPDC089996 TaxID=3364474 RepID=UPI0037F3B897
MSMRFDRHVVIITGASSGIGAATARAFAREQAIVVLADLRPNEALHHQLEGEGTAVLSVTVDVASSADCERLVNQVLERFGRIDVLFNNAGITRRATVEELDEAQWDHVMAVNLKSVFLLSRLVIGPMRRQGGGSIVNTASGWGLVGGDQAAVYCASKGGVVLLTKAMAIDHGPHKIRVNCICPGDTLTPMLSDEARQLGLHGDALAAAASSRPLGRAGRPEEIADAVLFLASGQSSFITGEALVVDGGGLAGSA